MSGQGVLMAPSPSKASASTHAADEHIQHTGYVVELAPGWYRALCVHYACDWGGDVTDDGDHADEQAWDHGYQGFCLDCHYVGEPVPCPPCTRCGAQRACPTCGIGSDQAPGDDLPALGGLCTDCYLASRPCTGCGQPMTVEDYDTLQTLHDSGNTCRSCWTATVHCDTCGDPLDHGRSSPCHPCKIRSRQRAIREREARPGGGLPAPVPGHYPAGHRIHFLVTGGGTACGVPRSLGDTRQADKTVDCLRCRRSADYQARQNLCPRCFLTHPGTCE